MKKTVQTGHMPVNIIPMSATFTFSVPTPGALSRFKLPSGVQRRLKELLDRQDAGTPLTAAERREAEGLVEMAEFLSLLKLRATRPTKRSAA